MYKFGLVLKKVWFGGEMRIPINLKLKRKLHKDVSYAQDIIIQELYDFFPNAVIHGGTAIWRCYNGNRFSEDIDVYISRDKERIEKFFQGLAKKGFKIIKKRVKQNSLYSALEFAGVLVRIEAIFKEVKNFILKDYEMAEGPFFNVYTLSAEDLIKEKVDTYIKRKKIRDLYDVFFLLSYVQEKKKIVNFITELIKDFKAADDGSTLKTLIISGPVPDSKKILDYIKRWAG